MMLVVVADVGRSPLAEMRWPSAIDGASSESSPLNAAAQKKRWAEYHKAKGAPEKPRRKLSAAGRKAIGAAARKRCGRQGNGSSRIRREWLLRPRCDRAYSLNAAIEPHFGQRHTCSGFSVTC